MPLAWGPLTASKISLVWIQDVFINEGHVIKKSFHLEEEDLQTATSRAETLGLPLNAYLRQAVINENNQRKVAEGTQSHLQGIYKALEELTQEMGLVRVASDDAQEASQQREQELIQKVSESLEEHRQQMGGMLRHFIIATNSAMDVLKQEAEPTPTTGKRQKAPPETKDWSSPDALIGSKNK